MQFYSLFLESVTKILVLTFTFWEDTRVSAHEKSEEKGHCQKVKLLCFNVKENKAMSVCLLDVPFPCQFCRPLIGLQVT